LKAPASSQAALTRGSTAAASNVLSSMSASGFSAVV
jgi:hypothetical protein